MNTSTCLMSANQLVHTVSPLKTPIGNLLSNLDEATQAEVYASRFIKQPLVLATQLFAIMIQKKLAEIAYFDIESGRFIRHTSGRGLAKCGPMGTILPTGYIQIQLFEYKFVQSHLVCLWFTGKFPTSKEEIDHINGNRLDDRPENLRIVSHTLNARNHKKHKDNTSGYTGVYYNKMSITNPYMASVKVNGKNKHLGVFSTAEEAYAARQAWIVTHPEYGYTLRHGL